VVWSFVYLAVRNLFALVWLLGRSRRSKELEILVLRHEVAIPPPADLEGCQNLDPPLDSAICRQNCTRSYALATGRITPKNSEVDRHIALPRSRSQSVRHAARARRMHDETAAQLTPALSLGSTDSLIERAAGLTHRLVDPEARLAAGITPALLRLSVGLEDVEDVEDVEYALATADGDRHRRPEQAAALPPRWASTVVLHRFERSDCGLLAT
jgi:hypothetical protein